MARKPNYAFERMERERAKALKQAERAAAKKERDEAESPPSDAPETDTLDSDPQN